MGTESEDISRQEANRLLIDGYFPVLQPHSTGEL